MDIIGHTWTKSLPSGITVKISILNDTEYKKVVLKNLKLIDSQIGKYNLKMLKENSILELDNFESFEVVFTDNQNSSLISVMN